MIFIVFRAQEKLPIFNIRKNDICQLQVQKEVSNDETLFIPIKFENLRTNQKIYLKDKILKIKDFDNNEKQNNLLMIQKPIINLQIKSQKKNLMVKYQKKQILLNIKNKKKQQQFFTKQNLNSSIKLYKKNKFLQIKIKKQQNKDDRDSLGNLIDLFQNLDFKVESIQKSQAQVFDLMKNDFVFNRNKKIKKL